MEFRELSGKTGICLAVMIFFRNLRLSDDILPALSIEELCEIWMGMDQDNALLQHMAQEALDKKSGTPAEWRHAYERAPEGQLKSFLFLKFAEVADTFEDWVFVFCGAREWSTEYLRAQVKLWEYAKGTFDEWHSIASTPSVNHNLLVIALTKLMVLASTFRHWNFIFTNAPQGSMFKQVALNKMYVSARTTGEWAAIYRVSDQIDGQLRSMAFQTIGKHTTTYEQWRDVYHLSDPGSELRKLSLTELEKLASCFDEWLEIYPWIAEETDRGSCVLGELEKLATSFSALVDLYQIMPAGEQRHRIFDKICEFDRASTDDGQPPVTD